ncbi:MAG: acetyltransferase [Chloroflexi bacterium]|nr:acetyltransferase [Chloroflexota bacterium]
MKPVVIFGLGSYARVAKVYLEKDSPHTVAAFTADTAYIKENELLGKPVVAFEQLTTTHPPTAYQLLVAIGASKMNDNRTRIYQQCKALGYEFITYVNSKAVMWGEVEIGENTFIFEQNVIQPFVKIGSNTVLWSGNHIGHDSTIGSNVFIASHAVVSGHCVIGDNSFLGVNATLIDGLKIAPYTLIGAGAFMTRHTQPNSAYIGARAELSQRTSQEFNI